MIEIANGKSTRANSYLGRMESELKQEGVEYAVFDKVSDNPTKSVVEEGGRFAKETGFSASQTVPDCAGFAVSYGVIIL